MVRKSTISPHDSLGSHLEAHVKDGNVMRVLPKENEEINEWSNIFVHKNRDDSKLQPILNSVIERWRNLPEDNDKELSKSQIRSYCKLFSYLSMINQFNNIELYRHYLFFEYLKKKFPPDGVERIDVSGNI